MFVQNESFYLISGHVYCLVPDILSVQRSCESLMMLKKCNVSDVMLCGQENICYDHLPLALCKQTNYKESGN